MIDEYGNLKCNNPNCSPKGDRKLLGFQLEGRVKIPCPRCHYLNIFDTDRLPKTYYKLDKEEEKVVS